MVRRVTTNGTLHMYRNNLLKSTNSLNSSMMKVLTGRQFDSYSFDPASATRAFKIHSSINETRAQYDNNQGIISKFETGWKNMQGIIDDLSAKLGQVPAMEGLNGPNLENLDTQAKVLRAGAESMIQSMNSKYNEDFIFAGSDNKTPPFAIDTDGHITYRGVKIDQDLTEDYIDPKTEQPVRHPTEDRNMTNQEMLDQWSKEDHLYVDIGLGFALDNDGNIIPSTAFDASIPGINVLGYGRDADGDPKNLAAIMLRMAEIFEGYDSSAEDPWKGNQAEANRLLNKFKDSKTAMIDVHADLDTKAKFLNKNGDQLKTRFDSLNTERNNIEDADPADAIMELVWNQTCYNAAIQVGANVIPQSLMDYLK